MYSSSVAMNFDILLLVIPCFAQVLYNLFPLIPTELKDHAKSIVFKDSTTAAELLLQRSADFFGLFDV